MLHNFYPFIFYPKWLPVQVCYAPVFFKVVTSTIKPFQSRHPFFFFSFSFNPSNSKLGLPFQSSKRHVALPFQSSAGDLTTRFAPNQKRRGVMELMSHSSTFLLPPSIQSPPSLTYALVVLNQSLPKFSPLLWSRAQLRLCADGGANRVYDDMPLLLPHQTASDVRKTYKPDVINGDMDSIRKEVLEFYANMGTKIVDESQDQDTTDLHKCVAYICDWAQNLDKSNLCILVAGAVGGRFDHEIGNINVLCRFSTIRIILVSDDCLIHLLPSTHRHEIHIQSSVEGPHCGLIPIGAPSGNTTTTGLQWDLNETEMRFGGLVSTSNLVKEDKITVQSDSDLLWTITIKKL